MQKRLLACGGGVVIIMTNREAYERDCEELEQYRKIGTMEEFKQSKEMLPYLQECRKALDNVVRKCNEYEQIGTVEECREAVEKSKSLDAYIQQILWERDIAIQQLEEIGISLGEKMDSVKETVERQKPKKIVYKSDFAFSDGFSHYRMGKCPMCDRYYNSNDEVNYCSKCGHAIRWDMNSEGIEDDGD